MTMPFSNIEIPGFILILIITLIIFGPARLSVLGRTLSEFKGTTRGLITREDDKSVDKTKETLIQQKVPTLSEAANSKSQMITAADNKTILTN